MIYRLFELIEDRKHTPRRGSYTNALLNAGQDQILQKIGEESTELIIAASSQGEKRLIEEFADLLYHGLVLLASRDLTLAQVEEELERRHLRRQHE
jgi:phosphoribosyl-ATP pyrophosphohydrolase